MNKVNITLQIHAFYKQYHDSHYIVTSDERLRLVEFRGEQASRRPFVLFGTDIFDIEGPNTWDNLKISPSPVPK